MKICVVGTGYVGLVTAACIANNNHNVICIDNNEKKITTLQQGEITFYEPNLGELISKNKERLSFSTDIDFAVKNSEVCIITVGTPQNSDGSADLSYVIDACQNIAKSMNDSKIIIIKSTVPPGSFEIFKEVIQRNTNYEFELASNPEFLRQGSAVRDFLEPDRVIVGTSSENVKKVMQNIYSHCPKKIINMDVESAIMVKYASNAFLAMKISFINEIANICEKVGANVSMIKEGIGADHRIGREFLNAGLGYGGSCFPKDVKALIQIGQALNTDTSILHAVDYTNYRQRELFVLKIISEFGENLSGKTFGVWGLSFKPNTDDMREAPSITIINALLSRGAAIKAYDPKAANNARKIFQDKILYCENKEAVLTNADALLILTEWKEFKTADFEKINIPVFDGRNVCPQTIF